jgi:hypothetical protein
MLSIPGLLKSSTDECPYFGTAAGYKTGKIHEIYSLLYICEIICKRIKSTIRNISVI